MERRKKVLDEIACLAYGLYERRGRAHGFALEDWLEAERIVMERRSGEIEQEAEAITAGRKAKAAGATKTGQAKKPAAKKKAVASGTAKKKTPAGKKASKKTE